MNFSKQTSPRRSRVRRGSYLVSFLCVLSASAVNHLVAQSVCHSRDHTRPIARPTLAKQAHRRMLLVLSRPNIQRQSGYTRISLNPPRIPPPTPLLFHHRLHL